MHNKFLATMIAAVLLFSVGCKKDPVTAPTVDPGTPAPSFNIASVTANCTGTNDCIQFWATPNADVLLVKVEIKYPVTGGTTYNFGSQTIVRDQSVALQAAGIAYTRISGTWTFTFTGQYAAGQYSGEGFVATASVTVGAKL